MRLLRIICAFLFTILIVLLFTVLVTIQNFEKVVVPKHLNLREDLYIVVHEETKDSVKVIYYRKRGK